MSEVLVSDCLESKTCSVPKDEVKAFAKNSSYLANWSCTGIWHSCYLRCSLVCVIYQSDSMEDGGQWLEANSQSEQT